MIPERVVPLTAADGTVLEGRLSVPAGATGGLVLCHPHPLYGGDMDNPVVMRLAEVAVSLGWAALRFNFRRVGGSEGRHDGGRAEQADGEAALAALRRALRRAAVVVIEGASHFFFGKLYPLGEAVQAWARGL